MSKRARPFIKVEAWAPPENYITPCQSIGYPDLFYEREARSQVNAATVCYGCEVQMECLTAALNQDEEFGVWGGYTTAARVRLKRLGGIKYLSRTIRSVRLR